MRTVSLAHSQELEHMHIRILLSHVFHSVSSASSLPTAVFNFIDVCMCVCVYGPYPDTVPTQSWPSSHSGSGSGI